MEALCDATIVFDLDGTLVDTAPDLLRALNETLLREGCPVAPEDAVRMFVGHGARAMITRAFAHAGLPLDDARASALTETFVDIYRSDIARGSRPFPGAVETLDVLAKAGARLVVCTNKRTDLSVQLLEALGLAVRFAAIVGADSVPNRKPHRDHYVAAVEAAGGSLARSIMVGDTAADVGAARAAGAPVVAVSFGYAPQGAETLGADAVIERFDALPAVAARLLGKA